MQIELQQIKIKDIIKGFSDQGELGVTAFDGKLNVRPAFQREMVYNEKQQKAVIDTIMAGRPLNVMYWSVESDDHFEMLDGQQRTLSICAYATGKFDLNFKYFHNLTPEEKEKFLNYELLIYKCSGSDTNEKLAWFETINIAGEKLNKQELLNATYSGSFLSAAKGHFSKPNCTASTLNAAKYLKGSPIRQDWLATVLSWISDKNPQEYLAKNQHADNDAELWQYFRAVINWVETIFPNYRAEMKGLPWGELFNKYKDAKLDPAVLERSITELMQNEDVTKPAGVYQYLLTSDEKYLSIRTFTAAQKRRAYERQGGICPACGKHHELNEMEGDHITPWSQGGKTSEDNLQMLCKSCNRKKSDK